jgi:hypothetical protein
VSVDPAYTSIYIPLFFFLAQPFTKIYNTVFFLLTQLFGVHIFCGFHSFPASTDGSTIDMAYQVAWRRGHVQRFTQPLDDTATGRGPQVYSSRTWRLHSARLLSDDQRIGGPVDYSQKEVIVFQLPVVGLETRVPTRFTHNVCRINSGCVIDTKSDLVFYFILFSSL